LVAGAALALGSGGAGAGGEVGAGEEVIDAPADAFARGWFSAGSNSVIQVA